MRAYQFVLVLLSLPVLLFGNYQIPDVTVQALKNGDFRAYIPDYEKLNAFTAHAKINQKILILETGDFVAEVKEKTGDFWIATFTNTNLKVGDTVYLWVSVTVDSFNYRREGISVTITEAFDSYPKLESKCVIASTVIDGGKQTCIGDAVINDEFQGAQIDNSKWIVEHYIPTYIPPRYVFNSYQNIDATRFIKNSVLYLKPIAVASSDDVWGSLDLKNGCTSEVEIECYRKSKSSNQLPPTVSAKVNSKTSFKYGKIEIRAKLPAGDWIFPVIELEQKVKRSRETSPKVVIAYSRGNDLLKRPDQSDVGSRVLFAGPVHNHAETERSKNFVSRRSSNPFHKEFHVYTLEWLPGKLTFKVDNQEYGSVDLSKSFIENIDMRGGSTTPVGSFDTECLLSLGVGVGGLVDFPDGSVSHNHQKPWKNSERLFIAHFFEKKSEWVTTWSGDDVALQVDYVKVTAL